MTDTVRFTSDLKRRSAAARDHVDAILASPDDAAAVERHIRSYILLRFALEDDTPEDSLSALAHMSLKRLDELRKNGVDINDVSPGCNGVSTESAKKALLLVSLQKALGIRLDAMQAAYIETIPQLAGAVSAALSEKLKKS